MIKVKAIVKKDRIIIPNYYDLKEGEIWLEVKFLNFEFKEHLELWENHLEKEKEKESPVDSNIVEIVSKELGLRGIRLEDLINGNF